MDYTEIQSWIWRNVEIISDSLFDDNEGTAFRTPKPYMIWLSADAKKSVGWGQAVMLHEVAHCWLGHTDGLSAGDKPKKEFESWELAAEWIALCLEGKAFVEALDYATVRLADWGKVIEKEEKLAKRRAARKAKK